jgi:uncharacterized membrane protein YqgA involved in biofilm formation
MLAVFVNCLTVIIGGLIGVLFSSKIKESLSVTVQNAAGVITLVLGFEMAFQYESIICLALSLILGGLIGTALDIDGAIYKLGQFFEKLVEKKNKKAKNPSVTSTASVDGKETSEVEEVKNQLAPKKDFAFGFLNASVLFCVGAMSIIGSFKAGIEKDYTIIFTKSILDGFMAIVFASSMGAGAIFSFITVFVYQGALTLLSTFIAPFVNDLLLNELSACGGAMIIMIGINLLKLKEIKTANFLPGLVLVVIYTLVAGLFS